MKKKNNNSLIVNRRAKFDYEIIDTFVAGIVLTGAETKCLRQGRGQLVGAYVTIKDGEAWLLNAVIHPTKQTESVITEQDQSRNRKLLLSKKELNKLIEAKNNGYTIVALNIKPKSRFIKCTIATAKGKKKYDKRQTIMKRETSRKIQTLS